MFDIVPNAIASVLTIALPVYASHRALRTADPAALTPWLTYWISFALFTLFENYTYFLLGWVPFYGFFRLVLLSYLVLPQTQGARLVYEKYVGPWLSQHEREIEEGIGRVHNQLHLEKIGGLIEWLKAMVLGQRAAPAQTRPQYSSAQSYAQNLLSRFNFPSAAAAGPGGFAAPAAAGDLYGLLSAAVGVIGNRSASNPATREIQVEELSRSGELIPSHISTTAEKVKYVSAQRERLRVLLGALDRRAGELQLEKDTEYHSHQHGHGGSVNAGEGLQKSKSEASFDRIEKDEVGDLAAAAAGWMGWALGGNSKGQGGEKKTQ
jgi:hypothetical protein